LGEVGLGRNSHQLKDPNELSQKPDIIGQEWSVELMFQCFMILSLALPNLATLST